MLAKLARPVLMWHTQMMPFARFRAFLLWITMLILCVQSASLGIHQGQHLGQIGFKNVISMPPISAVSRAFTKEIAPADMHWVAENCGLCQLQRSIALSVLVNPQWDFLPTFARFRAFTPTGPPVSVSIFRLRARAPPV